MSGRPSLSRRRLLSIGGVAAVGAVPGIAFLSRQRPAVGASPGEGLADVRQFGARGDGRTDDTAALNAAIRSGAADVLVPDGTYLVDADHAGGGGVRLDRPGVRLVLTAGAVLIAQPNALDNYSVVHVSAPDCAIEGGRVEGDAGRHGASTGEWGHCITVGSGADRCRIEAVTVTRAWGDGLYLTGRCSDVTLIDVVADDNRRQGLSIIDAVRPRVYGGQFVNTGRSEFADPAAGIDLEPDLHTDNRIDDALIVGAVLRGNRGHGFTSASNGHALSGAVVACTAADNGRAGFHLAGAENSTALRSCVAERNDRHGFAVDPDVLGAALTSCISTANGRNGFHDAGTRSVLSSCASSVNGGSGFFLDVSGQGPTLHSCTATDDCAADGVTAHVDIYAATAQLRNVSVEVTGTSRSGHYGYVVRPTAAAVVVLDCSASGFPSGSAWNAQATDAVAVPVPGG